MNAALVVAVIIGVFFVVGLAIGGVTVIALPMLRGRRSRRPAQREPDGDPVEYDQAPPDDPRWPGDGDNGYSGR